MTNKLAKIDQPITLPSETADPYAPSDHASAIQQAKIVAESGAYGITGPADAYVRLMTGHDLGLSPSQSLRAVSVINGRPSVSADALVAVCKGSPVCEYFRHVETTHDASTWETKRVGDPPERYTFSFADAEAAGLTTSGGNWSKYPGRMLRARAKAFLARDVYPDLTLGLYTPEELLDRPSARGSAEADTSAIAKRVSVVVEPTPEPTTEPTPETTPEPPWTEKMRLAPDFRTAKKIGKEAIDSSGGDIRIIREAETILAEVAAR